MSCRVHLQVAQTRPERRLPRPGLTTAALKYSRLEGRSKRTFGDVLICPRDCGRHAISSSCRWPEACPHRRLGVTWSRTTGWQCVSLALRRGATPLISHQPSEPLLARGPHCRTIRFDGVRPAGYDLPPAVSHPADQSQFFVVVAAATHHRADSDERRASRLRRNQTQTLVLSTITNEGGSVPRLDFSQDLRRVVACAPGKLGFSGGPIQPDTVPEVVA